MKFIADFHIHSKYSRATSKELTIPNLYKWSKIKGINILGTGDFTHPGWFKEIKNNLIPDGNGLFDLKPELRKVIDKELPQLTNNVMKFILTVEISSIYKKNGKVRKIHNVIFMPDLESAEKFNNRISKIGNIESDGRPILGLDSRDLLEIAFTINPSAILIPAHIWTPWFSLFGANSGFDDIEECFEDLSDEIFALETGLSSDPPMNWRLSKLDRFNLVSNSDAHSPANLAREANLFDTELTYNHIREALKSKNSNKFLGTLEFYPEEGKYHYDGHRNCKVRLTPKEAIKSHLRCPVCGNPITVGVLHRVEVLADRNENQKPKYAKDFESIVPLPEIISEATGVGKNSKKVISIYNQLINNLGNELFILRDAPIEEIKKVTTSIIAEGIRRVRNNEVKKIPGYDGEYGKIIIFTEDERNDNATQLLMLAVKTRNKEGYTKKKQVNVVEEEQRRVIYTDENIEQLKAIKNESGPTVVIAGPGTGKTYTLVQRILWLIQDRKIMPENILAITFTNKAANEIETRVKKSVGKVINVSTIHKIALDILKENKIERDIFDDIDKKIILNTIMKEIGIRINEPKDKISEIKSKGIEHIENEKLRNIYVAYQKRLKELKGMDYEDILIYAIKVLESNNEILNRHRERFKHILVDEFQDISLLEYKFIKLLAGSGQNLFIIGDPDQSIYQFRGADPSLFFKIKTDFKKAMFITLKKGYRNPDYILKPAINVISKVSKTIKNEESLNSTVKGAKGRVKIIKTPTDFSSAVQIAKKITESVGGSSMQQSDMIDKKKTRSFSDFAILVRASFLIPTLEEVLVKEGIPYKLYGEKSFFEKKIPHGIINFLKLLVYGFNRFRFSQVLRFWGISDKIIESILRLEDETRIIDNLFKEAINFQAGKYIKIFLDIYNKFKENEIKLEEILDRLKTVFENNPDFVKFSSMAKDYNRVEDFLSIVMMGKEQDIKFLSNKINSDIETVSIMTIHSAKGLEFPVVFLYCANEDIIPYKDSDTSEERRLFYVAMTRASEELYFVVPDKIKIFGKTLLLNPSRFISDINEKYIYTEKLKFDFKKQQPGNKQLSLF